MVCEGQCDAGRVSVCSTTGFASGYVSCEAACVAPSSASFTVTRGTHERPEYGDCRTYIACSVGYYKRFRADGRLQCEVCDDQRKPADAVWASEGLSVNDATSCLWECRKDISVFNSNRSGCTRLANRAQIPSNDAGWFGRRGTGLHQTCGAGRGRTSEAGTALVSGECLDCPPHPALATWTAGGLGCEWSCQYGARRGGVCLVEPVDCRARGYTLDLDGATCVRLAIPWARAGRRKADITVERQVGGGNATALASSSSLHAAGSLPYGVSGRHTVAATRAGRNWTVEGPLCSMASAWLGGREYLVGTVCNTSFLVYLDLSDPRARLGVLIGRPGERGWRDGFRTEALFQDELYVASGAENRTLFVLDRWNCLLREVSIADPPGAYLTRVYTVHGLTDKFASAGLARCYGDGSLASPRTFWALGRERVVFADEDGLWQLELATREVVRAMSEAADAGFEADDLAGVSAPDAFSLVLAFRNGATWVVRALEEECPEDWTSLDGGDCTTPCAWRSQLGGLGQYVNRSTGACVPCAAPACGVGQYRVPCTRAEQAVCASCPSLDDGKVYVEPGDCTPSLRRYLPPCPAGFYLGAGGWCAQCPRFSTTVAGGAVRLEQCKCVAGFVRRGGLCVTDDPLYTFGTVCAGNCTVPGNATLLAVRDRYGKACPWACNAGFFRDLDLLPMDSCIPCLPLGGVGQKAISSGDDGMAASCEFA